MLGRLESVDRPSTKSPDAGEWELATGWPAEPGDKPIILRPDDRPQKQSTRLLKAECPDCGYTIGVGEKWADRGLPTYPIEGAPWLLTRVGREAGDGGGLHVIAPAAIRVI